MNNNAFPSNRIEVLPGKVEVISYDLSYFVMILRFIFRMIRFRIADRAFTGKQSGQSCAIFSRPLNSGLTYSCAPMAKRLELLGDLRGVNISSLNEDEHLRAIVFVRPQGKAIESNEHGQECSF